MGIDTSVFHYNVSMNEYKLVEMGGLMYRKRDSSPVYKLMADGEELINDPVLKMSPKVDLNAHPESPQPIVGGHVEPLEEEGGLIPMDDAYWAQHVPIGGDEAMSLEQVKSMYCDILD